MTAVPRTIVLDYPAGDRIAAMRIGGMSVLERTLREAAGAGTTRAIVRADAGDLPRLPALGLTVDFVGRGADVPDDAVVVPADVVGGVTVTDRASARAAMSALLEACRRPYDGVADRYFSRHLSLAITRVLTRLPVRPNHVTLVNIAVGLAACWCVAHGTRADIALGGGLMFVQVILDSCDGELARIRHLQSRAGMILDNISDDVIDNAFVACLGYGLGGLWGPLGLRAAIGRGLTALMVYIDVARQGKFGDVMAFHWWFDTPDDTPTERFSARVTPLTVVRALGRRDLYVLVFAVSCGAGVPAIGFGLGVAICVSGFTMGVLHVIAKRGI